jgi:histidinol dehydrogenase
MKIVAFDQPEFAKEMNAVVHRLEMNFSTQDETVRTILDKVQKEGNAALLEFTRRFDRYEVALEDLRVSPDEIKTAYTKLSSEEVEALKQAAENIRVFHERQKPESWTIQSNGIKLGQKVSPLETAGIYVPGGKASYPSSVLMNAIPAKVAGVKNIVMCSPCPDGQMSFHALVAADLAGVNEIYKVGGAQAIAAMAFGNTIIPRVDTIVGPGNIYVALAKRMVFGIVGIDMVAGPSEILIVADAEARADYIAADLLSQAEHDEEAVPILVTPSKELAEAVLKELETQKKQLKRRDIIEASLNNRCLLFVVETLEKAVEWADKIAPEHLELAIEDPEAWVDKINNAGAIFMGRYTPEAIGDYMAGPNHVLPTSGTARFSSPLGVYNFIKRTSLISYTQAALKKSSKTVQLLANMEHLDGHANAVRIRTED